MPTDAQVRSALYAREQHAGDIEPLLARALAARRHRRPVAPVLVAALVLMLAATIALVTRRWDGTGNHPRNEKQVGENPIGQNQAGAPLPLRALRFALPVNSGYTVSEVSTEPGEQVLQLHPQGSRSPVQLLVYAPGNPDATPFALRGIQVGDAVPGLQSVDVSGRAGYLGTLSDAHNATPSTADYPAAALAWQYRSGAWAVLNQDGSRLPGATLLRLARTVDFASTTALRTAVTVTSAPAGMRLDGVDTTYPHAGYERAIVSYATPDANREVDVSVEQTNGGAPATGRPITVGPRHGRWQAGNRKLTLDLGAGQTLSVWAAAGTLGLAQATAIARTTKVAARPGTLSTWLPAAALP